jgi:hypothetical protein
MFVVIFFFFFFFDILAERPASHFPRPTGWKRSDVSLANHQ